MSHFVVYCVYLCMRVVNNNQTLQNCREGVHIESHGVKAGSTCPIRAVGLRHFPRIETVLSRMNRVWYGWMYEIANFGPDARR